MSKKQYAQDQPLTKFERIAFPVIALCFVFVFAMMIWAAIAPSFRSEEAQAAVEAEQAAAAEQRAADREAEMQARALNVVGNLVFVQHSETGLCFAVRSVYRHGYLSEVDCAEIPATLLLTTEIE